MVKYIMHKKSTDSVELTKNKCKKTFSKMPILFYSIFERTTNSSPPQRSNIGSAALLASHQSTATPLQRIPPPTNLRQVTTDNDVIHQRKISDMLNDHIFFDSGIMPPSFHPFKNASQTHTSILWQPQNPRSS